MPNIFVKLANPLKSVKIIENYKAAPEPTAAVTDTEQTKLMNELNAQKSLYSQACQTVQSIAEKLNHIYEQIYVEQSEQIAKLSVEIARKVLMQKVQDGDYEIESIIKEILKNSPSQQDLTVHLSPKDFNDCQKMQSENQAFDGIKLVSDDNVGNAECVLESPKGIIKSIIDEHLEEIGKALKKAG
ncbi:MAG: hypothetical protein A2Y10_04720 [Planctomycetes bacterium GWF2_41_51]|nr:MAG: hypothetical protein A2Y10_04720 [Planctomycetes bacterium GWF2_41_51]HBG26621.1 hypothetical protein [Phycisphaerales bacterium]